MVSIFDIHKMLSENPVYVHCKKKVSNFPAPNRDIPAGDGKIANLFLQLSCIFFVL
jgi:hypothetical protein